MVAVAAASALSRMSERRSDSAVALTLRDDLVGIRAELDACLSTRSQMELRFEELEREVARLRRAIDSLESVDARGVPAESYPAYLELVEDYNQTIPRWEVEGEELRQQSVRCRSLAEVHNARADSLRRFLVEAGIWEESWLDDEGDI